MHFKNAHTAKFISIYEVAYCFHFIVYFEWPLVDHKEISESLGNNQADNESYCVVRHN